MQDKQDQRIQFYENVTSGKLNLSETLKAMRKIAGMTQTEYAKLIGIAPRIIMDLERGVGNPTLKTLEKIAAPFGLTVCWRRPKSIDS